jgi:GNAT superfamily N-acetyltransferase
MEPTGDIRFRRRETADMPGAYRVFRRTWFDYLHRIGLLDGATAQNPPVEESWLKQRAQMEHLAATAAEDWVAEARDGRIVGWAQSVERDGLLELTLFFVDPSVQSRGIGRALLERAFPLGRGHSRAIVASQDPRALALYLQFGVGFATTSAYFRGRPEPSEITTDLAIERVEAGTEPAAEAAIVALERELLGHGRIEDTRFLLGDRPAWLARRGGHVVGMAFGATRDAPARAKGRETGPIGALDPADVPALIATVENDAAASGIELLGFTVPMVNSTAMAHVLGRRFQIDPVYLFILSSDQRMRLDRWVQTQGEYIV